MVNMGVGESNRDTLTIICVKLATATCSDYIFPPPKAHCSRCHLSEISTSRTTWTKPTNCSGTAVTVTTMLPANKRHFNVSFHFLTVLGFFLCVTRRQVMMDKCGRRKPRKEKGERGRTGALRASVLLFRIRQYVNMRERCWEAGRKEGRMRTTILR